MIDATVFLDTVEYVEDTLMPRVLVLAINEENGMATGEGKPRSKVRVRSELRENPISRGMLSGEEHWSQKDVSASIK